MTPIAIGEIRVIRGNTFRVIRAWGGAESLRPTTAQKLNVAVSV